MKFLKKYLLDILVVIAFAIISFVYFMPADMDGRILFRHDAAAGKGLGHEKELFQQQTGETTRWTNSVFGGMPTYQMSPSYDSNQVLSQIVKAYHLWLPDYVWYVLYTSWASISCCVPSTSDSRWRRWEVSSGHSRPTFLSLSLPDISGRYGRWLICRR